MIKLDRIISDSRFYNEVFDALSISFFRYEVQKKKKDSSDKNSKAV